MYIEEFEIISARAKSAINSLSDEYIIDWFNSLYNILSKRKFATIKLSNNSFIDVSAFAYTQDFASFFDMYNHCSLIDFSFKPIEKDKLDYDNCFKNIIRKN